MTGRVQKKLLFVKYMEDNWGDFERKKGLGIFKEKFLASPYKMIVVQPDFSQFNPKYNQCYVYWPLSEMKGKLDKKEIDFYHECIERLPNEENPTDESSEVVCLPGNIMSEAKTFGNSWTKSFSDIKSLISVISKQQCYDHIKDALALGIGPDEGGIMTPHVGDGVYFLQSV